MPPSDFLFVEVDQTGKVASQRDVRTAIQKHVMRDIGCTRRGQPRPRTQAGSMRDRKTSERPATRKLASHILPNGVTARRMDIECASSLQEQAHARLLAKVPRLVSGGYRADPFTSFPIQMTPETSFLIDYLLSSSDPRLLPIKETWLPLSLSDPALLYEILSHISRDIAASLPEYAKSERAVALHSQALQSVNRRLSDPSQSVSDGMIATVLSFACFSHFDQNWQSYEMHMEGLLTMIKIRGGANAVNHNRILRLLLSGVDISTSCFAGRDTNFPLPISTLSKLRVDAQEIPWWCPHASVNKPSIWSIVMADDYVLVEIFRDLVIATAAIKSELNKRLLWRDQSFLKTWVDPLTYRLLGGGRELKDIDDTNFVSECCRLGALLLLSKIRRRFGARLVFTGVETERLRTILEIYVQNWRKFKSMLLWTAVLAALETRDEDRAWFCEVISTTARAMKLREWDEVIAHASNLLWIGDVLDTECDDLRSLVFIE